MTNTPSDDLYWRLHSLSKILESGGFIDESQHPDAYATILDAMAFVRGQQSVVREPSEAAIVFAAISSGEWTVTRNQPSCYLTDEGNARNAWSVQRAVAPYCADLGPGNRSWNGPTALAALKAASKEMGIPLPITQKGGSNAE